MSTTYQYILICGCGRLGAILAGMLSQTGSNVVIVDPDETAFAKLPLSFSGFRVVGTASEIAILRKAGIEKADCVLAVTREDNLNLMVAQIARNIFHVPEVVARVFDPQREAVYQQFGIETICPTKEIAADFMNAIEVEFDGDIT